MRKHQRRLNEIHSRSRHFHSHTHILNDISCFLLIDIVQNRNDRIDIQSFFEGRLSSTSMFIVCGWNLHNLGRERIDQHTCRLMDLSIKVPNRCFTLTSPGRIIAQPDRTNAPKDKPIKRRTTDMTPPKKNLSLLYSTLQEYSTIEQHSYFHMFTYVGDFFIEKLIRYEQP